MHFPSRNSTPDSCITTSPRPDGQDVISLVVNRDANRKNMASFEVQATRWNHFTSVALEKIACIVKTSNLKEDLGVCDARVALSKVLEFVEIARRFEI